MSLRVSKNRTPFIRIYGGEVEVQILVRPLTERFLHRIFGVAGRHQVGPFRFRLPSSPGDFEMKLMVLECLVQNLNLCN